LIEPVRELLRHTGLPYVIENVPGAPLIEPIMLCGVMFGLGVIRHRCFESLVPLVAPAHRKHEGGTNSHRGYSRGGRYITVGGHNYNPDDGRRAMGIDWMKHRDGELNEAIPPAYTEHLGRQLLNFLLASGPAPA
jgi:DNA (cytosine-5)-methyltransferase 1